MIRTYSQKLTSPFTGVVHIAESTRARAHTFNGLDWDVQYFSGIDQVAKDTFRTKGYGVDKGYYLVAKINHDGLHEYNFPVSVDHDDVASSIKELFEFIEKNPAPYEPGDIFEYWLLDPVDESPLALIYSCCEESLIKTYPNNPRWTPLTAAKLKIEKTEAEIARGEAPVNDQLLRMVANRSGRAPIADWFRRDPKFDDDFPPLLIREDWQSEYEENICQRYLDRMSPKLLMLTGLYQDERARMEIAAKKFVFEVEEFYSLYPEVIDEKRMSAIRVEARLRRSTPQPTTKTKPEKEEHGMFPLSRDQRIFEA